MARHTLTIFTPNYNHGNYVVRAIESVVCQSRPPDQYIILDDGSTDNSRELIRPYAQRYPYITFLSVEHQGLHAAVDLAHARTSGDYFFSLAADDYILPGFLEEAMSLAGRHPEAGIVFGRIQCCDLEGRVYWIQSLPQTLSACEEVYLPPARFVRDYLEQQDPINSASTATIYKTTALREVGYRWELDAWHDTFMVWAIGAKYGACALNFVGTTFQQGSSASMSGTWFNDLHRAMGGITHAAQLMLSPEFCDRFPAEFVKRWHAGYLETLLRGAAREIRAAGGSGPGVVADATGSEASAPVPASVLDSGKAAAAQRAHASELNLPVLSRSRRSGPSRRDSPDSRSSARNQATDSARR